VPLLGMSSLSPGVRVQGVGRNERGLPELHRVVWRGRSHGNRIARPQRKKAGHAASDKQPAASGPSCFRRWAARGFPSPRSSASEQTPFRPTAGRSAPGHDELDHADRTGLTDLSAGKAFSAKLTELAVKVSGGYKLSSTGGAGWSNYSIAMHDWLDVKAFADQITWARVTRVSGQTIEIDASAQ